MTRQGTWVLLILLTWYLAGMFRTLPLTVLLLSELTLFAVMAALSAYFHRTLDAAFPSDAAFGEKARDCACRVSLDLRGKLPVGRPRLTLALSYPAQRRKTVQRFYGGAEPGQSTELEFYVRPPYCGPLEIELRQILTWDYLFLFPAKRKKRERMTLVVLPPPRIPRMSFQSTAEVSGLQSQTAVSAPLDGVSPETRDLREYRPGDSARAIHWKLSARTGQLWSREYEDEKEERFTLALDLTEYRRMRPQDWDAFYEIVSAAILGLLRRRNAVRVYWRDGARDTQWDVSDAQSLQAFFLRLYRAETPSGTPQAFLADFSIDTNLCWKRGTEIIWRFHAPNVVRDILEQTFVI